jgi:hypothetical protein
VSPVDESGSTLALLPGDGARRRSLLVAVAGAALLGLPGCAAWRQVSLDVATFGEWPQGRRPGSFALDRLPSQNKDSAERTQLEAQAAEALVRAGFHLAGSAAAADVLAQLVWRESRVLDPWYDDPWIAAPRWRLGVGYGARPWGAWGMWGPADLARDQQELGLLLLDRASRQPLVEVRVRHEGRLSVDTVRPLMLDAALQGFPQLQAGERRVTVSLPAS